MRVVVIALLGALLGACASTSQRAPAGVEEVSPGGAGQSGAQAQGVAGKGVQGQGLGSQAGNPLKDPSNILSKRSVYYDFDQYDVKDEYKPIVEAHAEYLRAHPDTKVLIQGNTDERGSREYNVALGQRRAEGVKKMLILLGAREGQIEAVSLGEEKPRDPGRSEAAYAQNRRSDILYPGEY
ncbi:MAG TPA: peptidoglycan-associated lipoprotein Pal [Burkholderiales bacterium]|nr:peptidoglycan-associated lipoprotein Pal [Burkholderiales bacterium]